MVTKLLPVPADSGGKLRTLALVKRLAATRPVTVVAFDEGDADIAALEALGVTVCSVRWARAPKDLAEGLVRTGSISSARFWSHRLAAEVRRVAQEHPQGTLIIEYVQQAALLRGAPAALKILASHNIESALVASHAASSTGPIRLALTLEAKALARAERRLLDEVDVVSVVSEQDRFRLGRAFSDAVVCPNGQEPTEILPRPDRPHVAFVAHMGWSPNVKAAQWFAHEVWPRVVATVPDATLALVGRSPAAEVQALAGGSIEVTGTVPTVAPELARATVAVAPLLSGGGTRLKILEALGFGRPVVATRVGAEGLEDLEGRGLVLRDDPAEMAAAIVELLQGPDEAELLGEQGHVAVGERFFWDATLAPLLRVVNAGQAGADGLLSLPA